MEIVKHFENIKKSVDGISAHYRRRLFAVLMSGAAMMLLLMLTDLFGYDVITYCRDAAFGLLGAERSEANTALNEVVVLGIQMIIYVFTLLISVSVPAFVFRGSKPSLQTDSKGAVAFIPFAMGASYIASFVASSMFSGAGDRFTEDMSGSLPVTVPGTAAYIVMLSLLPAIFEEIAFRGVMLKVLLPYGKCQAIVISAMIFGSMHINPPQALFAFTFGLLSGWLYTKTGTMLLGMLIHLTVNGISGIASVLYADPMSNYGATVILGLMILGLMLYAAIYGIRHLIKYRKSKGRYVLSPLPDVSELAPASAFPNLFKGISVPALALYAAFYITLLLIRYYPETVSAILGA